jgi:peptidoglycan/LPS O-acetylase OafA/YrhL
MAIFLGMGYVFCRTLAPYNVLGPEILKKKGYFQELESMRGILALSVVIHHAVVYHFLMYQGTTDITGPNTNYYTQLGSAPVSMFFFTTGFLFWSKLIRDPKPKFLPFMAARVRRLGPAYLGGAAFLYVLVAIYSHFQLRDSPVHVLRDGVHVLLADRPEVNGLAMAAWLWPVTWTLKLEFLFYLTVPFLGWFARTLPRTLLLIALCNLLYLLLVQIEPHGQNLHGYYLVRSVMRLFSYGFSVGFLCAHLLKMEKIRSFCRSVPAAVASLAIVFLTLSLLPNRLRDLQSLLLAFPFLAIACGNTFWGALRTRTLIFLGQISYSVYLIHFLVYGAILLPLHTAVGASFARPAVYWAYVFLVAPLILIVSTLWNRFLELPFMGKKNAAVRPARTFGPASAGMRPM